MNKPSNKSILLVEDEVALQEAVKLKLEQLDINVLTAKTAEDAILFFQKKSLVWFG